LLVLLGLEYQWISLDQVWFTQQEGAAGQTRMEQRGPVAWEELAALG
jgi:hypothetical protein